jgi:cytochrome b pre-mRNA-processing protein 3
VGVTLGTGLSIGLRAGGAANGWGRALAGFLGLGRRGRHERAGFQLYTAAVEAAREPFLYTDLGVPDTLDGRFDLVGLYTFLVIQRLKREPPPGPALAQAVFDAMFSDMDINLREMGVGDLSVGKRVKAMWDAFNGRANAYSVALAAADGTALEAALARNVWRGADPPVGSTAALARLTVAQVACLDEQPMTALTAGNIRFLPSAGASR